MFYSQYVFVKCISFDKDKGFFGINNNRVYFFSKGKPDYIKKGIYCV